MANLTRNLFIPYVDANTMRKAIGADLVGEGEDYTQIDKSTIFALAFNPQEETSGYIDEANDTTYVRSYQPELPQEIILDSSNQLFAIMYPFCMDMPTGGDAEVPVLLRTPNLETGLPTEAFLWRKAIISPTELNTVDGKLTFTLKLNGSIEKGTVSTEGGKLTFVAAGSAAPETFSLRNSSKAGASDK